MQTNTANKSKIVSTKTVYQSKFFRVNQVKIERDGKTFTKDIIEHTPIVLIIPYTKDGEIYVAREYRDALEKTILNVIGGKIDEGEDLLTSAKRELEEEVGLRANTWRHVATWEQSANGKKKVDIFFATDLEEGETDWDEDENIELVKLSIADALEKAMTGDIPVAEDVAAILLLDKLIKEGMNIPHTE